MTPSRSAALLAAWVGVACGGAQIPTEVAALAEQDVGVQVRWRVQVVEDPPLRAERVERGGVVLAGGGTLVVATLASGALLALAAADGAEVWRTPLGDDPLDAPPAAAGDTVYAIDGMGTIHAVDAGSGAIRWSTPLGDAFRAAPVVRERVVYVGSVTGGVYALDADSGATLWTAERRTATALSIAGGGGVLVSGDAVIAGFPDGAIGAYDLQGDDLWLTDLASGHEALRDVDSTPVVVDGVVVASSFSGGVSGLDAASGAALWSVAVEGGGTAAPAGDAVVVPLVDGRLLWLDVATGAEVGALTLESETPGAPAALGRWLLVPTPAHGIYVVERARPWLHARFDPGSGFEHPPAVEGRTMYALSSGGFIYAVDLMAL